MRQFAKKYIVYIYSVVLLLVFSTYQFFHLLQVYISATNSGFQVQTLHPEIIIVNGAILIMLITLFYTLPLMIYVNTDVSFQMQRPALPYSFVLVFYVLYSQFQIEKRVNRPMVLRC